MVWYGTIWQLITQTDNHGHPNNADQVDGKCSLRRWIKQPCSARRNHALKVYAPRRGTLANIRIYVIFLETRIIVLHFALIIYESIFSQFLFW